MPSPVRWSPAKLSYNHLTILAPKLTSASARKKCQATPGM